MGFSNDVYFLTTMGLLVYFKTVSYSVAQVSLELQGGLKVSVTPPPSSARITPESHTVQPPLLVISVTSPQSQPQS